jgi:hypothetical protein
VELGEYVTILVGVEDTVDVLVITAVEEVESVAVFRELEVVDTVTEKEAVTEDDIVIVFVIVAVTD